MSLLTQILLNLKKKIKKSKINHLAGLISNVMCQMVKPELGSRHYLAGAYKQN